MSRIFLIFTTIITFSAVLIAFLDHKRVKNHGRFLRKLQTLDIPFSRPHQLTYLTNPVYADYTFESWFNATASADTTVIILNWSRLENVLLLSTLLCSTYLQDTVSRVLIWNNNPTPLYSETFSDTLCSPSKLEIYNSPSNLYFQARFFACASAETPYCFIQDDDYLVRPEIIKALRLFIHKNPSLYSVHLLPPHEHLLSRIRTVVSRDNKISTSFAWLGHGSIVRRDVAVDFLQLLAKLDLAEDEMKMADNYFTILANRQAEIWFDHGIELGGGQPFTVGEEGNERNEKYMTQALKYLFEITESDSSSELLSYTFKKAVKRPFATNRSPCLKGFCLVESNINLIPGYNYSIVSHPEDMAPITRKVQNSLPEETVETYLKHPLSYAVDDDPATSFRSPSDAKEGDWLTLEMLENSLYSMTNIEIVLLVGPDTVRILQKCRVSLLITDDWFEGSGELKCHRTLLTSSADKHIFLWECSFKIDFPGHLPAAVQKIRIELFDDVVGAWEVYEVWLRRIL